ncbi:SCP-domain-containing protein [Microthyrium microscopicum]|uniref:SCP-domain-containing protein n=1 Tax=Microthyrium microscopicum TaxID=703497 RepID=A0A6A6U7Y5_9PEZI|nr:SCP-domain-containing protein [Microthyrium microscopicum]
MLLSTVIFSALATIATATPVESAAELQRRQDTNGVIFLINGERQKAGCQTLTPDSRLTSAAAREANDMATNHFFSHQGSDGSGFTDRISATGYIWKTAGENIYLGGDAAAAFNAWMKSPEHKANILNCGYSQTGVAAANAAEGTYWVQEFASF